MKLKIAMLSVHSCPLGMLGGESTGGMSVYIRELCRELGDRGHLVDVYTRAHDPGHDRITRMGRNTRLIHLRAGEETEADKLAIYPHLDAFTGEVEDFRKSQGLHYDLIHSHYWLSGLVGNRLQHRWGIPHVTMFHTLGAVKNAIGVGGKEPGLRIEGEKMLTRECHRIIAATEREKRDLIDYYGTSRSSISVVPCGVNLGLFRPVDKEIARPRVGFDGEGIILFVGRVVPIKGIDKLLMALTHLEESLQPRLVVIGGDEGSRAELEKLRTLSRSIQVQDSVTFLGLVKQEMLPYYYSAADMCVIPSYYESFGLVALESLACGTPVVATRVGGMERILGENGAGFVVANNDPDQLAEKISLLFSKSKHQRERSSRIRDTVTKFSWSNTAEGILREYESLQSTEAPEDHMLPQTEFPFIPQTT